MGRDVAPVPSAPDASRIFIDPVPTTIYVTTGAAESRSVDGGLTWQSANGGIADHWVRELAFDPADTQKLYGAYSGSATAPGGLFVTTNGGQDWSPMDLGTSVNLATAVAVDPRNAALVYSAASQSVLRGGLLASSDGGATWAVREGGLSGYYSYAVAGHPSQGGAAYCVSGPRVYRTDDRGQAWTLRGASSYGLTSLVLDPSGADTLYAGYGSAAGNGVVKSVDGGASWNPATNGLSTRAASQRRNRPPARREPGRPLRNGGRWLQVPCFPANRVRRPWTRLMRRFSTRDCGLRGDRGRAARSPDGGTTWSLWWPADIIRTSPPGDRRQRPSRVYAAFTPPTRARAHAAWTAA
jgi:hypothetical protein